MTALPDEIGGAIAEGCKLLQLKSAFEDRNRQSKGRVKSLWVKPPDSWKSRQERTACSMDASADEEKISCDIIISAIGQATDIVL